MITGVLYDATGSYDTPFAIIIGIFIFGMVALLATKRPGRMPIHEPDHGKDPPEEPSLTP